MPGPRKRREPDAPPSDPPPPVESPPAAPPGDGTAAPTAPPPEAPPADAGNGNGGGGQPPLQLFSVPVARDTYVQASVWERTVTLKVGEPFVSHEVTCRKRLKDALGEWKSVHSFRASELYALQHVLRRAEEHILSLRMTTKDCPF